MAFALAVGSLTLVARISKVDTPGVVGVPAIEAERLSGAVVSVSPVGSVPEATPNVKMSVAFAEFVAVIVGDV